MQTTSQMKAKTKATQMHLPFQHYILDPVEIGKAPLELDKLSLPWCTFL